MKYFILCCLLVTSSLTFAQVITTKKANNERITIQKLKKDAKLDANPVVVINENMILTGGLDSLNIDPNNIVKIDLVKKDTDKYVKRYGPQAKNGVVFIETKEKLPNKNALSDDVLYLINGKKVSKEVVEKLSPDDIESMNVIKDKSELAKYPTQNYVAIVSVKLKNKKTTPFR